MPAKHRILIADDDAVLAELLRTTLTDEGYEVVLARDGREALVKAVSEAPDLILLDIMMPYVDGYHIIRDIIGNRDSTAPIIVVMTARDTKTEAPLALQHGASEVLQKPFPMAVLHERLRTLLADF